MTTSTFERFPRVVTSLDELPAQSAAVLASQLHPDEEIVQALLAPRVALLGRQHSWRGWLLRLLPWEWSPEWALVATQERLLLAKTTLPGTAPVGISLRPADLLSLELGTILLFSWLELCYCTAEGSQRAVIHFNTVGINHFRRLLFQLAIGAAGSAATTLSPGQQPSALSVLPFKFRNIIAQRLLAPGEEAEVAVYRAPLWSGGKGWWRRPRAPGLALVLTNYHLWVATEDEASGAGTVSYGFIARCYPRTRVQGLSLALDGADLWLELRAGVGDSSVSERILVTSVAAPPLEDLLARLTSLPI